MAQPNRQNVIISRDIDPFRQFMWRAEWVTQLGNALTGALFALRQLLPLAEGGARADPVGT